MNTRPKRTDSEKDILEMQRAFLSEKSKNPSFQPAAGIVKIEKAPKKSLFAKSRDKSQTPASTSNNTTLLLDEVQERSLTHSATGGASSSVSPRKQSTGNAVSNVILGDIVEKIIATPKEIGNVTADSPFPKVERISLRQNIDGKSLFALSHEAKKESLDESTADRKRQHDEMMMIMDCEPAVKNIKTVFGDASIMLEDPNTACAVHKENLEILGKMEEGEILAERQKILESIDPALLEFLANKRKQKLTEKQTKNPLGMSSRSEKKLPVDENQLPEGNPAIQLLNQSTAEQWIHFDVIEKDKLEWMRDIPQKISELKVGDSFEARFDWKGVLLPYLDEASQVKDDRELYLHGDEPFRPGYTLQELFRLARSNVIQQRVSAFAAIGGILSIYNQGFYDRVLELPIAKIFFLLRFGLDENTPAILEVVSKALALLVYNETDETLLDFIYENTGCYWQPILEVKSVEESDDPTSVENLQKQMKQLTVKSTIKANVQESEEDSKTSMSDFQLAETDLIECLLRSNIIQRIYFILNCVKTDNSTVSSCLKILIRIARTNKDTSMQIICSQDLLNCLFTNFLPGLQSVDTTLSTPPFYNYPQYLVLKLCRVLISQSLSFAIKLRSMNIVDRIQNYLFNQEDIKENLIRVQIESLRVFRALMLLSSDNVLYRKFLPAFRYMLEFHYNHVIFDKGGPYLIRQHASALLGAISSGPNGFEVSSVLGSALLDCCCNWFHKATQTGIEEFSQSTLLTSCLNAVAWFTRNSDFEKFRDFIGKYLKGFIESEGFLRFEKLLNKTSIILHSQEVTDRRNVYTALPNVGATLLQKLGPQLAIPQTYCVYFLASLWRLVEDSVARNDKTLVNCLLQVRTIEPVIDFLKNLLNRMNPNLTTNFFAKCELRLVSKLLCFDGFKEYLGKTTMLRVVYNFVCGLTAEHIPEIEKLFERVIFNRDYLDVENQETLDKWRNTFLEVVYPHYVIVSPTEISLSLAGSPIPILPRDWPYFHLKIILENYVQNVHQQPAVLVSEREVVQVTLAFTSLLESETFQITTPTEKLMYLMIVFMGPDSQFLEPTLKARLKDHITQFYKSCADFSFEFDTVFKDKCKFQNLYALFVDHFQAVSYGDDLFSSMVLIPLAQKYDNKWRRMVWSEHASVLRFLNCDESLLIGGIDAYLNPFEEEESLIKCYAIALNTNLLRPNTIAYRIAQHHFDKYKKTISSTKN